MEEVLQTKLEAHIQQAEQRHVEAIAKFKEIDDSIKNKVSYREFTWIMGIMILILMAMFGYIAVRIDGLAGSTTQTQSDVSFLRGKLAPYDVQFKQ
jgi:hypothetical protein